MDRDQKRDYAVVFAGFTVALVALLILILVPASTIVLVLMAVVLVLSVALTVRYVQRSSPRL